MKIKEAYQKLAEGLGMDPEMMPYLNEINLDLAIINPMLADTVRQFGKIMELRPGQTVLELACGKAGVSLPMAYVYKVRLTGIDLMPDFIGEAWSRAEYSGLAELCNFMTEDAVKFVEQTKGQWDAVVCVGVLSHLWNGLESGVKKLKPLVKPGGHLLIGEPYLKPGKEAYCGLDASKDEITALMEEYGQVVNVFDDGENGWQSYIDPQQKSVDRLKEDIEDNPGLVQFLDDWMNRLASDREHLGFAAWVVKIEG